MLGDGTLAGYIDELSVTGLTSNPTIFDKAISGGDAYDEQIAELAPARSDSATRGDLLRAGARRPARRDRPLRRGPRAHRRRRRLLLARGLAADRRRHRGDDRAGGRLHAKAERDNLFIKIPGTEAGLPAIEESIFAGIPINVTLLFDDRAVPRRRRRLHEGDRAADRGRARPRRRLGRLDLHEPLGRRRRRTRCPTSCTTGSAWRSASSAYRAYRELLDSPRMQRLMNEGARPQRLLWASTGTKDPDASDALYIEGFASPFTVNTMPEPTLHAFADHGEVGEPLPADGGDASEVLARVRRAPGSTSTRSPRGSRRRARRPSPSRGTRC